MLGCTVTLLFAFLPLLFLPEGAGKFIRSLPAAVLYTVAASLFVALTVIPFLASRLLKPEGDAGEGNRALQGADGRHPPQLRAGAAAWRSPARARTLLAAFAFVARLVALVPLIGFSLFPSADIPQFRVTVETPDGASIADTDRALRFVEGELARRPEDRSTGSPTSATATRASTTTSIPEETNANVAEVFVELHDFDPRRSPQLLREAAREVRRLPGRADHRRELPERPADRRADRDRDRRARTWSSCSSSRPQIEAIIARDTGHARRRQSGAAAAHRSRPRHRHAEGGAARRRAGRGRPHRARGRRGPERGQVPRERRRRVRHHAAPADAGPADARRARTRSRSPSATGTPVPLRQLASPQFSSAPSLDPPARPRARGA